MAQLTIDGDYVEDMMGGRIEARTVYTYTDGRRWVGSRYEQAVRDVFTRIQVTQAGRALKLELDASRGALRIIPWPVAEPTRPQGQVIPDQAMMGCPAGEHPWARGGIRSRLVCTGGGSDAALMYTPAQFQPMGVGPAGRDAVLYHELVHAIRYLQGRFQATPARSVRRYTNAEEFFAIVVTNVYLSEIRAPLRYGHADSTTILQNPDTWMNHPHNRQMVGLLVQQQGSFCEALAGSPARFNPFRELRPTTGAP
jgi:hypothetical protein